MKGKGERSVAISKFYFNFIKTIVYAQHQEKIKRTDHRELAGARMMVKVAGVTLLGSEFWKFKFKNIDYILSP